MTTDAPPRPTADSTELPGMPSPASPDDPPGGGRARRPRRAGAAAGGADAAPKPKGGRPKGSTTAATITRKLREITNTVGAAAAVMGDTYSASVLTGPAGERFCAAWGKAAAENPRIRRYIDGMAAGGLYGELVLATAALVVPIAARYGLLGTGKWANLAMAAGLPDDERDAMMMAVAMGAAGGAGAAPGGGA